MGRVWKDSPRNWISNWIGCRVNSRRMSIGLNRRGRYQFRSRENRASFARWESRRFTTGPRGRPASRRCSIDWTRSSSRCSMKPTSDIGEGDRRKTPCAKCGKRFRAVGSVSNVNYFSPGDLIVADHTRLSPARSGGVLPFHWMRILPRGALLPPIHPRIPRTSQILYIQSTL